MKYIHCFIFLFLLSVSGFGQTTKTPPITPRWALEHIVWEDSANNQDFSAKLVDLYVQHRMPVGAIIIDSPWSTAYNSFEWNKDRYPDPAAMIQKFNTRNVKVILWITGCENLTTTNVKEVPIQKSPGYDEVVAKGYAINDGNPSTWWKGVGVHIDFTNPKAVSWWNNQLDKVFVKGVYGWKVDQGEIYFGDTVLTSKGPMTNVDFRPYYYNSMYQYTTSRKPEGAILGRPFSHQGGFEASVDQLSLGWCGDFEGSWSGLKTQIDNIYKSAEAGYGAPGCEVGGFFRARSTKNQLIRYAQFGAMTASMINGGENGAFSNHLPWYHDEETADCYRKVVWLHTQLIPYIFSTIVHSHLEGGSIIKNVSYPQESHTLGDFLFTKAITSEINTVSFKLPVQGDWIDFWTGNKYPAGSVVNQTYAFDRFPLFIRSGAIIPMNISNSYSGFGDATLSGKQTVLIYPEDNSSYVYFRPTGEGIEYEKISISFDNSTRELKVQGRSKLPYVFLIHNQEKPSKVTGATWEYDSTKRTVKLMVQGKSFNVKIFY